jgi:glycosyltransferase involved in cell wall biosynthesis
MKIAVVTGYNSKKPAGLERSLIETLRGFNKINKKKKGVEYIVYTSSKNDLGEVLKYEGINDIRVIKVSFGKYWKNIGLFFAPKADIYFFNGPLVPLLFSPKNYYVLVYDFAYKYFGSFSVRKKLKTIFIDFLSFLGFYRSKGIITISEATKENLVSLFNVKPEKITTIYLGLNKITSLNSQKIQNVPKSFFMFIGTLKERKNVLGVVDAFCEFKKNTNYPHKLIIVGKNNQNSVYVRKLNELINKEHLMDDIIFTNHITDREVLYLYENATALIFPSLLEGFGFPILEAFDCNTPVITSNLSSLGEIAGEGALLVDPLDKLQIANAMKNIIEDENLVSKLLENGRKRLKFFSWDKNAKEYTDLFTKDCK